jgi:hypothetical protein
VDAASRRILEAAMRAIDDVLADTPFQDLGSSAGSSSSTYSGSSPCPYLDVAEEEARNQPPSRGWSGGNEPSTMESAGSVQV